MEEFDLYDKFRLPLHKKMVRGEQVPENCYRQVVHCVIFNTLGDKMLIQKRLPTKLPFADKWDITCGGSSIVGENSCQAIHRELLEELGLDVDFSNLRPALTTNFLNGFNDVFVILKDVDLNTLTLQPTEVEKVMWATKAEIFNMIDDQLFIPYCKPYIDFLFTVKNRADVVDRTNAYKKPEEDK